MTSLKTELKFLFHDHLIYSINTLSEVFNNEGILALFKKGFIYYFPSVLLIPFLNIHKKKLETSSVSELVSFTYSYFGEIIRPGQVKSEITKLLNILNKRKPLTVLEIGTCKGGTLFLWSQISDPKATLISIDLPYGKFGGGYHFWKIPFYKSFTRRDQNISLLRCDSHKIPTLKQVKNILNGQKIDFLFIDGDHTELGVTKDFNLYKDLVKKGGIIAFHDIAPHDAKLSACAVDCFWKKIKNKYKSEEIIENISQGWAGIGWIYV